MSTSLIDSPVCLPQVTEDVEEDHNHEGYWMRLDQWNRFRHDTYKNCREDELQYITNGELPTIAGCRSPKRRLQPTR
ncbi:hypothetical protein CYMTET_26015 [Cymbomonas tetramitiformis]|uniref:Uncharacterized protein n=1 Tax=Cymbomonas tetramitiformis TaxID=36881 RepID=A0AAE0FSN8_9CHLO|nr:hypothetical protein CYMTET_26015 [Cymbomonas tetramitiformis]